MYRELTARSLVINSLFYASRPIPIEPDFWEFISLVSQELDKKIRDVKISDDHYSIEDVLWHNDPMIQKSGNTISLTNQFRNACYFDTFVNRWLDNDIKQILPEVIKTVFERFYGRTQQEP
jgi:hypothetical protein